MFVNALRWFHRNSRKVAATLALVLLACACATSASGQELDPQPIGMQSPSEGSLIPAAGSVQLSKLPEPWLAAGAAVEFCNIQTATCATNITYFTDDCSNLPYAKWFTTHLSVRQDDSKLGTVSFADSHTIAYEIRVSGDYEVSVSMLQKFKDPTLDLNSNATCFTSDAPKTKFRVNEVATINALDADFVQRISTLAPTFGKSFICDDGDYDEVKPGQVVSCSAVLTTTPLVRGTAPFEYLIGECKSSLGVTCKPAFKAVGTLVKQIGANTSYEFTVPKAKLVDTVWFGVRVKGVPKTFTLFASTVIQPPDPATSLAVSIRGPLQVTRGKSVVLSISTSPKITGTCQLTSHPGASDWGNLGTFKITNGLLRVTTRLSWPYSYGDGIKVGATAKCGGGKRVGSNIFLTQGFLP